MYFYTATRILMVKFGIIKIRNIYVMGKLDGKYLFWGNKVYFFGEFSAGLVWVGGQYGGNWGSSEGE